MNFHSQPRLRSTNEFLAGLTAVVIADTSFIASAVIDSLPDELLYFLVGPKNIAFLRRSRRCKGYFENALSLEEQNKTNFVRTIEQLAGANSNMFLIPVDDSANRIVHATVDRLGVNSYPVPDSVCFETLNDKWQFYQHCANLNVRVPKAIRLNHKFEIDFEYLCTALGRPFVLKPTNKSASLGFKVIRSNENLRTEVLSCRQYDFSPLIAQSFIPGVDIDISVLADRGHIKSFAIQTRKNGALCFVQNAELLKFTEVILREFRYTGVIHIDARLHDVSKEIFLIEANPRFWGSLAVATSGGLNFVRAGIYACKELEGPDPTTISDVSVPSIGRILAEVLTFKRNYFRLGPLERLRLRRGLRSYFWTALHLDS
jgi:predicted ATP-grasp superfamily ATP-dependent carboligase